MVGMKSQDNVSYFTMNKKISKKKTKYTFKSDRGGSCFT